MEQEQILELLKSKGFTDTDDLTKVFAALESKTIDLDKYKARASTVAGLEAELQTFKDAKAAKDDLEKTETRKLIDKIAKIEGEATLSKAAVEKAQRSVMLERGIAENMGGIPENLRNYATDHMRTVLPGKEWADAEALKTTITDLVKGFNELLPKEMRVVPSSETPPPRVPNGTPPVGEKPVFDMHAALHPEG